VRKRACFVRPSRITTMRVVFASEVEATKLVGAPSREVKSGGASGSVLAGAETGDGDGEVTGTRWTDEQAATEIATRPSRREARPRLEQRIVERVSMTSHRDGTQPREETSPRKSTAVRNSDAITDTK
jgi:hypothetical protein